MLCLAWRRATKWTVPTAVLKWFITSWNSAGTWILQRDQAFRCWGSGYNILATKNDHLCSVSSLQSKDCQFCSSSKLFFLFCFFPNICFWLPCFISDCLTFSSFQRLNGFCRLYKLPLESIIHFNNIKSFLRTGPKCSNILYPSSYWCHPLSVSSCQRRQRGNALLEGFCLLLLDVL